MKDQKPRIAWLLPLILPFGVLFLGGILVTLHEALTPQLSLDNFQNLFSSPGFTGSLLLSFRIGIISALGSSMGGLILSLMIYTSQFGNNSLSLRISKVSEQLLYVPIMLPPLAAAYLVLFWFGSRGMWSRWLYTFGFEFASPLFQGNGFGIMLAYWYKQIPFSLLMILPVLRGIPQEILLTGRMLGASWSRVILTLLLPRLIPVVSGVFLLLLIYNIGSYDIPFILGESRNSMISQVLYRMYFVQPIGQRPLAAAGLMVLFSMSLLIMILLGVSLHHIEEKERKL